jgi:hypothetical protein
VDRARAMSVVFVFIGIVNLPSVNACYPNEASDKLSDLSVRKYFKKPSDKKRASDELTPS